MALNGALVIPSLRFLSSIWSRRSSTFRSPRSTLLCACPTRWASIWFFRRKFSAFSASTWARCWLPMVFAPMCAKEKSRFARAKRLPVVDWRLPWWLCRVVILSTLITFYGDSDGFDCQSAAFFGAPVVTLGRGRGSVPKLVLDGRDVLPCFEEQAGQGAPEVVPGGALGKGGLFEAFVQDLARGFIGDCAAGDDLAILENLAEDGTGVRAAQVNPLVEGGQGAVEQEDQALLVSLAVPDQEVGAVVCVGEVVDHDVPDLFIAGAGLDCEGDQGRVTGAGRGGVVGAGTDQGSQVFFREVATGG